MNHTEAHARKRALLLRIQTEGAEAAYTAALEVCNDVKAPAPARATCATTILRAGGYLNAKGEDGPGKQPHEMTAAEISAQLREMRALREKSTDIEVSETTAFG
ncbi:hypothetical protein [Pacificitalea manganoxidans]|uniref:hypothetical protein n=1 Tax=Pacificitalea manganoxidans TaxID=1411902 RepID=UPI0018E0BE22|nr:hypothetical protein [Pacificitalea manganoxidans]MDR6308234.1 hypothetical protein [Pacificitalea manganoxidans]